MHLFKITRDILSVYWQIFRLNRVVKSSNPLKASLAILIKLYVAVLLELCHLPRVGEIKKVRQGVARQISQLLGVLSKADADHWSSEDERLIKGSYYFCRRSFKKGVFDTEQLVTLLTAHQEVYFWSARHTGAA